MKYILIVILNTSSFSAEFNSLELCDDAGYRSVLSVKRGTAISDYYGIKTGKNGYYFCQPKGEGQITSAARSARDEMFQIIKEYKDGN